MGEKTRPHVGFGLSLLLLFVFSLFGTNVAKADGDVTAGTMFTASSGKAYTYIPSSSGVLTVKAYSFEAGVANYGEQFFLYTNSSLSNALKPISISGNDNGGYWEVKFNVNGGTTYYLGYTSLLVPTVNFMFELQADAKVEAKLSDVYPNPSNTLDLTAQESTFSVTFSPASVTIGGAEIQFTNKEGSQQTVTLQSGVFFKGGSSWHIPLPLFLDSNGGRLSDISDDNIANLVKAGTDVVYVLKNVTYEGTPVAGSTFTGDGVTVSNGDVTITYKTGAPAQLVSQTWPEYFYDKYQANDPLGIVTLTFDANIDTNAVIECSVIEGKQSLGGQPGENDKAFELDSQYITVSGKTITLDFTHQTWNSSKTYVTVLVQGIMANGMLTQDDGKVLKQLPFKAYEAPEEVDFTAYTLAPSQATLDEEGSISEITFTWDNPSYQLALVSTNGIYLTNPDGASDAWRVNSGLKVEALNNSLVVSLESGDKIVNPYTEWRPNIELYIPKGAFSINGENNPEAIKVTYSMPLGESDAVPNTPASDPAKGTYHQVPTISTITLTWEDYYASVENDSQVKIYVSKNNTFYTPDDPTISVTSKRVGPFYNNVKGAYSKAIEFTPAQTLDDPDAWYTLVIPVSAMEFKDENGDYFYLGEEIEYIYTVAGANNAVVSPSQYQSVQYNDFKGLTVVGGNAKLLDASKVKLYKGWGLTPNKTTGELNGDLLASGEDNNSTEGNVVVAFPEATPVLFDGAYTIQVPDGAIEGVSATNIEFSITGNPLKIEGVPVTVTPESGTIDKLSSITVEWDGGSMPISATGGAAKGTLTTPTGTETILLMVSKLMGDVEGQYNYSLIWNAESEFTAPGNYTLNIPAGAVKVTLGENNEVDNLPVTAEYTIEGQPVEVSSIVPENLAALDVAADGTASFVINFTGDVKITKSEYKQGMSYPALPYAPTTGSGELSDSWTFTFPKAYIDAMSMEEIPAVWAIIEAQEANGTPVTYNGSEEINLSYSLNVETNPGADFEVTVASTAQGQLDTFLVSPGEGFDTIEANDANNVVDGQTVNFFKNITIIGENYTGNASSFADGVVTFAPAITASGSYTISFPYKAFTLAATSGEVGGQGGAEGSVTFDSQEKTVEFTVTIETSQAANELPIDNSFTPETKTEYTFTPDADGVLTMTITNGDKLFPSWLDTPLLSCDGEAVEIVYSNGNEASFQGATEIKWNLEAGKTYVFYLDVNKTPSELGTYLFTYEAESTPVPGNPLPIDTNFTPETKTEYTYTPDADGVLTMTITNGDKLFPSWLSTPLLSCDGQAVEIVYSNGNEASFQGASEIKWNLEAGKNYVFYLDVNKTPSELGTYFFTYSGGDTPKPETLDFFLATGSNSVTVSINKGNDPQFEEVSEGVYSVSYKLVDGQNGLGIYAYNEDGEIVNYGAYGSASDTWGANRNFEFTSFGQSESYPVKKFVFNSENAWKMDGGFFAAYNKTTTEGGILNVVLNLNDLTVTATLEEEPQPAVLYMAFGANSSYVTRSDSDPKMEMIEDGVYSYTFELTKSNQGFGVYVVEGDNAYTYGPVNPGASWGRNENFKFRNYGQAETFEIQKWMTTWSDGGFFGIDPASLATEGLLTVVVNLNNLTCSATLNENVPAPSDAITLNFTGVTDAYKMVTVFDAVGMEQIEVEGPELEITMDDEMLYLSLAMVDEYAEKGYTFDVTSDLDSNPSTWQKFEQSVGDSYQVTLVLLEGAKGNTFNVVVTAPDVPAPALPEVKFVTPIEQNMEAVTGIQLMWDFYCPIAYFPPFDGWDPNNDPDPKVYGTVLIPGETTPRRYQLVISENNPAEHGGGDGSGTPYPNTVTFKNFFDDDTWTAWAIPGDYVINIPAGLFLVTVDDVQIPNQEVNLVYHCGGYGSAIGLAEVISPETEYVPYLDNVILSWGEKISAVKGATLQATVSINDGTPVTVSAMLLSDFLGQGGDTTIGGSDVNGLMIDFPELGGQFGKFVVSIPADIIQNEKGAMNEAQSFTFHVMETAYGYTVTPKDENTYTSAELKEVTVNWGNSIISRIETAPQIKVVNRETLQEPALLYGDEVNIVGNNLVMNLSELEEGTYEITIPTGYVFVGSNQMNYEVQLLYTINNTVAPANTITVNFEGAANAYQMVGVTDLETSETYEVDSNSFEITYDNQTAFMVGMYPQYVEAGYTYTVETDAPEGTYQVMPMDPDNGSTQYMYAFSAAATGSTLTITVEEPAPAKPAKVVSVDPENFGDLTLNADGSATVVVTFDEPVSIDEDGTYVGLGFDWNTGKFAQGPISYVGSDNNTVWTFTVEADVVKEATAANIQLPITIKAIGPDGKVVGYQDSNLINLNYNVEQPEVKKNTITLKFEGVEDAYKMVGVIDFTSFEPLEITSDTYEVSYEDAVQLNFGMFEQYAEEGYTYAITTNAPEGSYTFQGSVTENGAQFVYNITDAADGSTFTITVSKPVVKNTITLTFSGVEDAYTYMNLFDANEMEQIELTSNQVEFTYGEELILSLSLKDEYAEKDYTFIVTSTLDEEEGVWQQMHISADDLNNVMLGFWAGANNGTFNVEIIEPEFDGISSIVGEKDGRYVVYNMNGVLLLNTENAADLNLLEGGLYIVNGKKILVRK